LGVWFMVAAFALGMFTTLIVLAASLHIGVENEIKRAKEYKALQ